MSTIRALTLATPEQQAAWLALFNDEEEYAPHGDELKAWLTGGNNISTKTALFDLADYDGTIITDLLMRTVISATLIHFGNIKIRGLRLP